MRCTSVADLYSLISQRGKVGFDLLRGEFIDSQFAKLVEVTERVSRPSLVARRSISCKSILVVPPQTKWDLHGGN